ncbi:BTAD domain-containing putative transcriptional regulator, partial [Actinoplanes sp. NPDC051633]|uniref:ATP-binding protein n=1 Tax=Actinoplanes sp. NPDC051633 TaxID=3155670 RepID=UPI0034351EA8
HAAAGRPGEALQAFESLRGRLADTLGTDPTPELAELHLELLRAERPARRGNLPAEVSSFVGRDSEVREIRELIPRHRLVTLIGPGGSGKTRLSVVIGAGMPGEVWRVELAPVTDPAEVATTILTALGMRSQVLLASPGREREQSVDPLTRLTDGLAGKRMLIILDNCEHLIAAVAEVAEAILRAAPELRLLATSREPLGIPGERLHPVEPLPLPPADADPATAAGYPAVRLLLDRAPTLVLDEHTAEPVIRICRALDGMPLAIELAAARLRTLPVTVLADRLADRFRLLTGGSRTALPRHRTLRAVVDWSWDLLSEPERALWRRFAMFHGGAGPEAVERVCDADLDLIGALVDKSLLVLTGGRYRMLETIREYGLERLADAGETGWMRERIAEWLIDLAGAQEHRLRTGEQLDALRLLAAEHDNLHAAVRAAVDAGDVHSASALAARLGWYWWLSGHRAEGLTLAREVIDMPDAPENEDRALNFTFAALNGIEGLAPIDTVQGWFVEAERLAEMSSRRHVALRLIGPLGDAFRHGMESEAFARLVGLDQDPDPWIRAVAKLMSAQLRLNFGESTEVPEAEMREGLKLFRSIGERWGVGYTLSCLGDLAASRGDFGQAVVWQREAIGLVREVGLAEDVPQLEVKLAHQMWMAGDRDEARRAMKQAQIAAEEIGMPEVLASIGYGAATIAREDGDLDAAREHLDRAWSALGDGVAAPQFRAMIAATRGLVAAAEGDLVSARELHVEALRVGAAANDAPVLALLLVGIADLRLREGDPAEAARLLGAAVAVR